MGTGHGFCQKKTLDFSDVAVQCSTRGQPKIPNWSTKEICSLLTFIMLYTDGSSWVGHKNSQFWGGAGKFIQVRLNLFIADQVSILTSFFVLF